jgi:dual oxidase
MTGVTGMFLVSLTALIYIFATPYARRHLHDWFWFTHACYPIFYALIILHGAARLVQVRAKKIYGRKKIRKNSFCFQEPFFHYFFLGPCVLFVLDTLVSMSRKKVKIPVLKAELLPSGRYAKFCSFPSYKHCVFRGDELGVFKTCQFQLQIWSMGANCLSSTQLV